MKDSLTSLREEYVGEVSELLREVVRAESAPESSLAEMCEYHLDTGGKRLRAMIPLAIGEAVGADPRRLLPFAAACELLHNATLVHDDLQDGDETRRDEPTVWKKYGRSQAINLGDAMLYWALACLDRLEVDASTHRTCIQRFVRRTLSIIEGQQREFELMESSAPTKSQYLEMVEGKTGGLFVLTTAGAAELVGASPPTLEALQSAGRDLGVLFQIQDDLLDLYGDKGRGERGADLREGKVSALVVHYLELTSEAERDHLLALLRRPRGEVDREEIETMADHFRESGALDAALDELEHRRRLATEAARDAPDESLRELIDGLAALFVAPIRHLID